MDVIADFPADAQAPEPVQQREALLDHPSVHAQPGAVFLSSTRDERCDALGSHQLAILVMVIATIGVDRVWALAWTPRPATHRGDRLNQGHELSDVVAVAAGQRDLQRDTVRFGDQMMLRASSGTVDRARSGFGPPFMARRCEPSITALDQSSSPAAFSSASTDSCNRCQTPASFQSRSRRQQVIPDPKPNSWGKNSYGMAV
jgi:hypothetical protein